MTLASIRTVAKDFLESKENVVLAIKGHWGVGKTYTWSKIVEENREKMSPASYCYVSLFGMSSIAEIRTEIVAKTIPTKLIGKESDFETINKEWTAYFGKGIKALSRIRNVFEGLPYVKNISVGFDVLSAHLIRETVICLDDFERLDAGKVSTDALLGLISSLKEEKKCKIVLIFNEDGLADNGTYKKYREKVVDVELLFSPTPLEAAELAFPQEFKGREDAISCSSSLGITNIRILKKISRCITLGRKEFSGLHAGVEKRAIKSIVLLAWCYYDANDSESKPAYDFVRKFNSMSWAFKADKEADPVQKEWGRLLSNYGQSESDKFEQALCKIIENGHLEGSGLKEAAILLDARLHAMEIDGSFSTAWEHFHDTFDNNEDAVVNEIYDGLKKAVSQVSSMNLSGTTMLLRELNRPDLADELIDFYLDFYKDDGEERFDLKSHPFSSEIRDPVVLQKFQDFYLQKRTIPSLKQAVDHIVQYSGWSDKHIESLTSATVDDFYDLFKASSGRNLHKIVDACLRFERMSGSSMEDEYRRIGKNARDALVRIAGESLVNRVRARRYGVELE